MIKARLMMMKNVRSGKQWQRILKAAEGAFTNCVDHIFPILDHLPTPG